MIVDCHTHGGPDYLEWWNRVTKTDKDFISYLDKCGVDKAIVGCGKKGLEAKTKKDLIEANEYVFAFCKKHQKKYIPTVNINPKYQKESISLLRSYRKQGVVWVGELCGYVSGYAYDTPEFKELMDVIAELDMITHFHSGNLIEIEKLVKSYPKSMFVLPHPGRGRKEIDPRVALAAKYKNLYIDIAGSGSERIGNIEEMIDKMGDDRILYGSDFTINEPGGVIARIKNSMIADSSKKKILGENTLSLLRSKGALL